MKKKLFLTFVFAFLMVVLIGCGGGDKPTGNQTKKLNAPTGFAIEDDYVYFNIIAAASEYVIKFEGADKSVERTITESGISVGELLIPEGTYQVSIKAKGDGVKYEDSDYSTAIEFTKEQNYMELKERELTAGGYIKWMGRTYYNEVTKANEVYHSASGFELFFKGSEVVATITATNYDNPDKRPCIVIVVDDDFNNATTLFLDKASQEVVLVSGNEDANEHKVDLYKRSESLNSHIAISSIRTDGVFMRKIVNKQLKLEFIAASSSTGYGNLGSPSDTKQTTANSDALKGFAFLTAQALDADINIFSASGWGCYASQWTNPNTKNVADAYKYVDFDSTTLWFHEMYVPDVVVVNLGTNDWSYIKNASGAERDARMNAFQQKYVSFLRELHTYYPNAQLIVLYGLMNETDIYDKTEEIVQMAKAYIPNLVSIQLHGDAGGYNSHPSATSHVLISRRLTEFIKQTLENNNQ